MPKNKYPYIGQFVTEFEPQINYPHTTSAAKKICEKLVSELGLTKVKTFAHKFNPYGVSVVVVIAESHLALHTWPELNYIHLDLVSCKKINKKDFKRVIQDNFHPSDMDFQEIKIR